MNDVERDELLMKVAGLISEIRDELKAVNLRKMIANQIRKEARNKSLNRRKKLGLPPVKDKDDDGHTRRHFHGIPIHGHVGVYYLDGRNTKPWQAKIGIGDGRRLAKAFQTKEEAIAWRIEMETRYGIIQTHDGMNNLNET